MISPRDIVKSVKEQLAIIRVPVTEDMIHAMYQAHMFEALSQARIILGHLDADIGASRCRQPEKGWIMQSKEQVEKLHAYVTNLRKMVMP